MATTNYNRIYTKVSKQYVWWIERDSIGISLYDPMASAVNQFLSPSVVRTVTLFYYKNKLPQVVWVKLF